MTVPRGVRRTETLAKTKITCMYKFAALVFVQRDLHIYIIFDTRNAFL